MSGGDEVGGEAREMQKRLRAIWSAAFMTPLIYVAMAWGLLAAGVVRPAGPERHPWDTAPVRWSLAAAAAGCLGGVIALRVRRRAAAGRALPDRERAAARYQWIFFATLCLADAMSFLALVYYCLSGRILVLLAGGALTFAGYFIACPREGELEEIEADEDAGGR